MVNLDRFAGPNEPLALLHFAFRSVVAEPNAELARRGFHRLHHRVLFFIARTGGTTVGELLLTLAITKQALHRPMQQLVAAGLVRVQADADDRRTRRLTLTRTGISFEERLSGVQRRMFEAAFRKVGRDAQRGWRAVMRELASQL